MANRIVSVHAGIYWMGIYAIMLPSSGFSVAHWLPHTGCIHQFSVLRNSNLQYNLDNFAPSKQGIKQKI